MSRLGSKIGAALVLAGLGSATAAGMLLLRGHSQGAAPEAVAKPVRLRGSGDCLSCHTLRTGNYKSDFVLLNEFATWRLSDPHSLAYVMLESKRGRQIGKLLGFDDVTRSEAGCLGCHAPQAAEPALPRRDAEVLRKEGVGCESCHGASEQWFGPHSEGDWRTAPADKLQTHMYDVRNPAQKASLCVSCHVGDAKRGRVVTHAMYAAGHPPLPSIEVADFSEQMPSHWRRPDNVPFLQKLLESKKTEDSKVAQEYGVTSPPSPLQSRQVVASAFGALAGELDLVARRSRLDGKDAASVWPERALPGFKSVPDLPGLWPQIAMAHSDCASCHHELAHDSWRQVRGFAGRPGRVPLAEWPFALTRRGVGVDKSELAEISQSFRKVTEACDQRPFGDPVQLGKSAQAASAMVARVASGKTADPKALLRALTALGADEYPSFDSARQIVAALRIVQPEAGAAGDKLREPLQAWFEKLDLETPEKIAVRHAQQKLLIRVLESLGGEAGASRAKHPSDTAFLNALDQYQATGDLPKDAASADAVRRLLHALTENGGTPLTLALAKDTQARRELEEASDARYRASLRSARDYDPREFKAFLQKLHALLPPP